ncbi:GNAT family N-acetyltransferase [Bosea sp. (in: a-proteobacteria)]|uniref:GNAT family N-acetyltransferase n=1 Tax=Bosea sp. (in: a-proteobacteria) TaxID=1871050 RepID=UPI00120429C0|nr:GNAT family N-acetyltransferase [Bosea sp. (in: a-proteobacteria)]TAJ30216.1 MAG: GNAT family N-acetyltransferase [Bosea sp. (in: a-proteobacteria)]
MTALPVSAPEITIRRAKAGDVARIAELIMLGAATQTMTPEAIREEARHPGYESAFAEIDASRDNGLFVAERDGEVVGTFQVTLIPGLVARGRKRGKIESVHVAPECRGMGIGKIMIGHALAFAEQQGVGLIELSSNKSRLDAHRFYRNLGFDQSHEGFKKQLGG